MAAAIALSMAAAEEDEARDAAKATAAAPSPAPAPPAEEKSQTESKEEECKSNALPSAAKSDPSSIPAPSASVVAPLTAPVVTETWFDSYCMALALLDALCTDGAKLQLPLGVALAAMGVSASSSPFAAASPSAERATAAAALLTSEAHSGVFTAAHDEQLIALANQLESKHSLRLITKMRDSSSFVADLATLIQKADRSHFPLLRTATSSAPTPDGISGQGIGGDDALVRRLCLLVLLNSLVQGALPLCDLSLAVAGGAGSSAAGSGSGLHSLAQHVSFFRGLLLSSVKIDFTHATLDATCLDGEAASRKVKPSVTVDRLLAAAHGDAAHSVFNQTYAALAHVPIAHLLGAKPVGNPHTAFNVSFKGEHVVGESGPWRELVSDIINELQADPVEAQAADSGSAPTAAAAATAGQLLPYFVPSVNRRVQTGEGRDRWLLNPACSSDEDKQRLAFIGALMGLAVRTGILLPLSWPRLLWKQLLDLKPTRADLEAVDAGFVNGVLRPLEECAEGADSEAEAEARFHEHFGSELTWTTTLSDGKSVDLRPNGGSLAVLYSERQEYARLAEWARLNEAREQTLALKRGLLSTLPAAVLSLLSADELERMVCGQPTIDVDLLRRHTVYASCSEQDQHIKWFWQCLAEMTQEQLRAFLVFSSASARMPSSDEEFTTRAGHKIRMQIKAAASSGTKGDTPDQRFMTSDTCQSHSANSLHSSPGAGLFRHSLAGDSSPLALALTHDAACALCLFVCLFGDFDICLGFWNISLPAYSSLFVMRRMLLTVLSLSSGMDGDDVAAMEREQQDDFDELQRQEDQRERELFGAHADHDAEAHGNEFDGGDESPDDDEQGSEEEEEEDESDGEEEESGSESDQSEFDNGAAAADGDGAGEEDDEASLQEGDEEEEEEEDDGLGDDADIDAPLSLPTLHADALPPHPSALPLPRHSIL